MACKNQEREGALKHDTAEDGPECCPNSRGTEKAGDVTVLTISTRQLIDAVVAELLDEASHPYGPCPRLSEFDARRIAGGVLDRVLTD